MNDQIYDDIQLEKQIESHFGVNLEVDTVITRHMPTSRTSEATLFLTSKKQLYLYISSQSPLVLGDIQKMVHRIGLRPEAYVSPVGRPNYFDEVATKKFQSVFPGRRAVSPADLMYYRKLVPYRPALVLIAEVLEGTVYQYDPDSTTNWRPSTKFTYRRIRTS